MLEDSEMRFFSMHYTLKEQTTDTFQDSGVSHSDGVKKEDINSQVEGLNAAKKSPENRACLCIFIPKMMNSNLLGKVFHMRSVC